MSKTVSVNYTDTAISGVSSLNLARGLVNFDADWKVKHDEPNQLIVTNLTSPISFPETFRFGCQEVADVYKGSKVDATLYGPSKRGVSILAQLNEVWTVNDSTDATYQVALPVSAHIVIKVPSNENITPAMIQTLLGRVTSGFYNTGLATTERLQAMLRGSLKPSDL